MFWIIDGWTLGPGISAAMSSLWLLQGSDDFSLWFHAIPIEDVYWNLSIYALDRNTAQSHPLGLVYYTIYTIYTILYIFWAACSGPWGPPRSVGSGGASSVPRGRWGRFAVRRAAVFSGSPEEARGAVRASPGPPRGISVCAVGLRVPTSVPVGLHQHRAGQAGLFSSRASPVHPPFLCCSAGGLGALGWGFCCAPWLLAHSAMLCTSQLVPKCVCRVMSAIPFLPPFWPCSALKESWRVYGIFLWRGALAESSPCRWCDFPLSLILLALCCLLGDLKLFEKGVIILSICLGGWERTSVGWTLQITLPYTYFCYKLGSCRSSRLYP